MNETQTAGNRPGLRPGHGPKYQFIDYATQGYMLLSGLLILFFHGSTVRYWPWLVLTHAVGLGVVHGLLSAYAKRPANKVLDFLRHFYPVLLYTFFYAETSWVNLMFVSGYLDSHVIRIEEAIFGGQPALGFMNSLPWLPVSEVFYFFYFSYYIMITGIGLTLYLRNRDQFFHYVSVVSFVFYVCYLTYIFLPVIGPRVFFNEFPGYYTDPSPVPSVVRPEMQFPEGIQGGVFYTIMKFLYANFGSTGAALPSSHVAVAICTLFFSFRYLPRLRWIHSFAVLMLCMATVYCRYHYLVDVFAGILTAAVLIPIANALFLRTHPEPGDLRFEKDLLIQDHRGS